MLARARLLGVVAEVIAGDRDRVALAELLLPFSSDDRIKAVRATAAELLLPRLLGASPDADVEAAVRESMRRAASPWDGVRAEVADLAVAAALGHPVIRPIAPAFNDWEQLGRWAAECAALAVPQLVELWPAAIMADPEGLLRAMVLALLSVDAPRAARLLRWLVALGPSDADTLLVEAGDDLARQRIVDPACRLDLAVVARMRG